MGIYGRKKKISGEKALERKHWLHLLPAAAVIAVLAASVISAENSNQTVSSASAEIVSEKELKELLSSGITEEDKPAKEEKTSSSKASKIKTGKIKTSSSKRTVPSSSSAGGGASGGMGSTLTPVMQIPESGYQDGTYEGSGIGFGGTIRVSVTISGGKIISISILEAEGETASYLASAKGVISRVIAQQSPNVDAVSGATYSSNGIIQAVQNAVAKAAVHDQTEAELPTATPVPEETASPTSAPKPTRKPAKEPDGYKDGTYTGTGTGFNGPVILTVKIKNGVIKKISAEHQDTDLFFSKAWETLEPQILEKQSVTGIDTVSGATYSSIGILEAMEQVIRQAGYQNVTPAPTKAPKPTKTPEVPKPTVTPVPLPGEGPDDPQPTPDTPADEEETPDAEITPGPEVTPGGEHTPGTEVTPTPGAEENSGETPDPEPTPEPEGPYIDGTYSGTSWGYSGKVTVTVTISKGQITSITQTNKDTAEFFDMAWQAIIPTAMSQQSVDGIDTVSGATFSSLGILEGLQSALAQARR